MACYSPITIRSPYNDKALIEVPCGKCAGCRRALQDSWYLRFIQEQRVVNQVRFITLTYDEENIPQHIDEDGCIHYDVSIQDLQRFFKKMRKKNKFKYFAVSEYGTHTQRPHYHLLLFSNNNIDIDRYWRFGFCVDLPANKGSFRYVTKYLLKGSNVPYGSTNNFMLCSKNPAIGKDFVDCSNVDLLDNAIMRDHEIVYPLPRYYRKKLYEKLIDKGESKKMMLVETMESKLKNSDMYRKFLKHHRPDQNFYDWLIYMNNKNKDKQTKIKQNGKI